MFLILLPSFARVPKHMISSLLFVFSFVPLEPKIHVNCKIMRLSSRNIEAEINRYIYNIKKKVGQKPKRAETWRKENKYGRGNTQIDVKSVLTRLCTRKQNKPHY